MADGQELPGRTQNGHSSHQTPRRRIGREREEHGGLTAGKKWVGDGSGKAVHGGSDLGGRRGFSERRWRPPKRERGRNWSGERERDTRGARLRLKRGRGAGRAIPRRATWARAAVAADARCGCGRKGAALTCGPGRQRLKEEREARRLQQGCARLGPAWSWAVAAGGVAGLREAGPGGKKGRRAGLGLVLGRM